MLRKLLKFFGYWPKEPSLHTGEVTGSIPVAPTTKSTTYGRLRGGRRRASPDFHQNIRAFLVCSVAAFAAAPAVAQQQVPNILTVMLDDMSMLEFRRVVMPQVFHHIVDRGTTFRNFQVTSPVCGPNRSTFHSGRLPHNHGYMVCNETAPATHMLDEYARRGMLPLEDGPRFQANGHRTAMLGRYNAAWGSPGFMAKMGFPTAYMPPGWDDWLVLQQGVWYRDWPASDRGVAVTVPDYISDVLADRAIAAIDAAVAAGKPFHLNWWPPNPHATTPGVPTYPEWASSLFADTELPADPDLGAEPVGKHPGFATLRPLTESQLAYLREDHRSRLRSVYAADRAFGRIARHIEARGLTGNTVMLVTSDNGYKLGHHRLHSKNAPYRRDLNVPLAIAGPGILMQERTEIVQTVDILPTLLDLAGAPFDPSLDGQSAKGLLTGSSVCWRRYGFSQHWGLRALKWHPELGLFWFRWRALTTPSLKYIVWHDGFTEYYEADQFEMVNTADTLDPARRAVLQSYMDAMSTCTGVLCHDWKRACP
jgi:N-acetylglucosamine-6-sulfatase